MGLIKTNYEVTELKITLPNAYAIVTKLNINGTTGSATIAIQSSRENALLVREGKLKPIKEVNVAFNVNVNENPYITAYTAAKESYTVKVMKRFTETVDNGDGTTKEVPVIKEVEETRYKPLYGWTDNIVNA